MADCYSPVGVFDSGLGGLTVAREIIRQIPDERIVYFGDTARVPYGSKSKDTIIRYTDQILRFLDTQDVKAIVVACNTVSSYALEEVRDHVNVPIIGVVKPGARVAAATTVNRKIGILGTEGTVASGMYPRFIGELNPEIEVTQKACPLLCPLVEEGWWNNDVTFSVLHRYLEPIQASGADTLILGCTHYPLLRSAIREVMGEKVNLVNPAYETAIELRRLLTEKGLLYPESGENGKAEEKYRFFVSDDPERFCRFATSVLKFDIEKAEKVNIESF